VRIWISGFQLKGHEEAVITLENKWVVFSER